MVRSAVPEHGEELVVSFPAPKVLQLRLNRPKQLNAMTETLEADLRALLDWFEDETSLWVVVITGTGRIFCAGQDLKNWLATKGTRNSPSDRILSNPHGFASIARRRSKKTIICAMNGPAFGGGGELIFNCDVVIAAEGHCAVSFPEVLRGVTASVGGIPNAMLRSPMFSPYLLSGGVIPHHLLVQHLFTEVVTPAKVLSTALNWAKKICDASPDAVWVTKEQINLWKDGLGVNEIVTASMGQDQTAEMYIGENCEEGLRSFSEVSSAFYTSYYR